MHTKDFLAQELERAGLFEMAAKAREGYYHDFLSPLALPEMQLLNDLKDVAATARSFNNNKLLIAVSALIQRHINGEFDASPEESAEWAKSPEGQAAFAGLVRPRRK